MTFPQTLGSSFASEAAMLELDSRIPLSKGEIRKLSADHQISNVYHSVLGTQQPDGSWHQVPAAIKQVTFLLAESSVWEMIPNTLTGVFMIKNVDQM